MNPEPSVRILWARRTDDRYPSTVMLRRVLHVARVGAYIDNELRTRSHIAVVLIVEQHYEDVRQLMAEAGWAIDELYAPTAAEIEEREERERRKRWSVRRTVTLSGPRIDELFGEQYRGRRAWNYNNY